MFVFAAFACLALATAQNGFADGSSHKVDLTLDPADRVQEEVDNDLDGDSGKKVDAATAEMNDASILAAELNLSPTVVLDAMRFQINITEGPFADLIDNYQRFVSRMWFDKVPAKKLHIDFVKGTDVQRVRNAILDKVGEIPDNVEFTNTGTFSIKENTQRAEDVALILARAGYRNFETEYDVMQQKIRANFMAPDTSKCPTRDTVGKLLSHPIVQQMRYRRRREEVRDGELSRDEAGSRLRPILGDEVIVDCKQGDGDIIELEHSRGGNWLRDRTTGDPDWNRECTSGWAVEGPNGDGIVTAAHCVGLDGFEEEDAVIPDDLYSITWRRQERDKGDAEYHTTSHIEPAEFFAREGEIRDVESTKATIWMTVGSTVCEYGRSNNVRTCDHSVVWNSVTATFNDGVTVRKLCKVTGDDSIGGDSGGGWSYNTKAWGVHSGSNGVHSYFTPVGRVEKELDVTIKTK